MNRSVIGLDIGGANLKISDGEMASSQDFPLWKSPEQLSLKLHHLYQHFPQANTIALTMTGELADCFRTKSEGVHFILNAAQESVAGKDIAVWQTGGEFFSVEEAKEFPQLVAAANWHALATWAGRVAPKGASLLIDIGSTTTDIIPIHNGIPLSSGLTDLERLQSYELLYTGAKRTPLIAIAHAIQVATQKFPLASEVFATTYDLGLINGLLAENPNCCETTNGRPATISEAYHRLARTFCADIDELDEEFLNIAARILLNEQVNQIAHGIKEVCQQQGMFSEETALQTVLTAGEGEYLAQLALDQLFGSSPPHQNLSLTKITSSQQSIAACATALAFLGSERL